MDHTQILPDIGSAVSTDLINLDALDEASHGEVLYAATMLAKAAATRMADPNTYHQLATFQEANGSDWSGFQGQSLVEDAQDHCETQPGPPETPIAPDNYVDSLPAMGAMFGQLTRAQDVMMANYARTIDSVMNDQRTYLGTPYSKSAFRDAKHYLRDTLKFSAYLANKHVERATCLTYQPGGLPGKAAAQPKFSQLAASFTEGRLPGENADRVVSMDKDLTKYATKTGESVERKDLIMQALEPGLIEAGEHASPEELSQTKQRWMDRIAHELNPDGPSPAQALAKTADNALRTRRNADGSGRIWMDATPAVFAKFNTFVLHQSNFKGQAPNLDPKIADLLNADTTPDLDQAVPVEDPDAIVGEDAEGNPITAGYMALLDGMTQGQKLGAMLIGVFNTLLSMDPAETGIKKAHGAAAQLVIVQDLQTAYKTLGHPDLPPDAQRPPGADGILPPIFARPNPDTGPPDKPDGHYPGNVHQVMWTPFQSEALNTGSIHPSDAATIGCNAEIVAQIWNGPDTVLQQKRTKRHHTPAQRRAILARDRGCQAPGCTVPGVYCDIHHIVAWLLDGTTDETNATALCSRHHGDVHIGKWTIRKHNGLTFFQPAPWLDPYQPLLRNMYWNS